MNKMQNEHYVPRAVEVNGRERLSSNFTIHDVNEKASFSERWKRKTEFS